MCIKFHENDSTHTNIVTSLALCFKKTQYASVLMVANILGAQRKAEHPQGMLFYESLLFYFAPAMLFLKQ